MQYRAQTRLNLAILVATSAVLLASCGGGSGGEIQAPPEQVGPVVQGTAAVGLPIANGQLSLKCVVGEQAAATDATGRYQLDATNLTMPCVLSVSAGTVADAQSPWVLSTTVMGPGVANLSPWTHLVMARLLAADPAVVLPNLSAADLDRQFTEAKLSAATNGIRLEMGRLLGTPPPQDINPLTTPFSATPDNGMTELLDQITKGLRWTAKTLPQAAAEVATGSLQIKEVPQTCRPAVLSGFTGSFNDVPVQVAFDAKGNAGDGSDNGGGGAGDGAGGGDGAGAGGSLGQFLNAVVRVERSDGSLLGQAVTDADKGMVTVVPCRYQGPVHITVKAKADGSSKYFEESTGQYAVFSAGEEMHAVVPSVTKNMGITLLTEAAWQYMLVKNGPDGWKTQANVVAANQAIISSFNQFLPKDLQITDITRLPFLVGGATAAGSLDTSANGVYGIVSSGLARAAGLLRSGDLAPALKLVRQLGKDLCDGVIDLTCNGVPVVANSADAAYLPPQFAETLNRGVGDVAAACGKAEANSAAMRVTQIQIGRRPAPPVLDPKKPIVSTPTTDYYTDNQPIVLLRSDGKAFFWADRKMPAKPYFPEYSFNQIFPQFGENFTAMTPTGQFVSNNENVAEDVLNLRPNFTGTTTAAGLYNRFKKDYTAYMVRLPNGKVSYFPHYTPSTVRFESLPSSKETLLGNITAIALLKNCCLYTADLTVDPTASFDTPVNGVFYSVFNDHPTFLAVTTDGSVYAWGNNQSGTLGNGLVAPRTGAGPRGKLGNDLFQTEAPAKVLGLPAITSVTGSTTAAFAIDTAGKVWTWGSPLPSSLGLLPLSSATVPTLKPVQLKHLDAFGPMAQLSCDSTEICLGMTRSGKLLAWGPFTQGGSGAVSVEFFPLTDVALPAGRRVTFLGTSLAMNYAVLDDGTLVVFPTSPTAPKFIDTRAAIPAPPLRASAPTCVKL
jgi:hypothetical protein